MPITYWKGLKISLKTTWDWIRIMLSNGATCLFAECCFRSSTIKIELCMIISSSSNSNVTCSLHVIHVAEDITHLALNNNHSFIVWICHCLAMIDVIWYSSKLKDDIIVFESFKGFIFTLFGHSLISIYRASCSDPPLSLTADISKSSWKREYNGRFFIFKSTMKQSMICTLAGDVVVVNSVYHH